MFMYFAFYWYIFLFHIILIPRRYFSGIGGKFDFFYIYIGGMINIIIIFKYVSLNVSRISLVPSNIKTMKLFPSSRHYQKDWLMARRRRKKQVSHISCTSWSLFCFQESLESKVKESWQKMPLYFSRKSSSINWWVSQTELSETRKIDVGDGTERHLCTFTEM